MNLNVWYWPFSTRYYLLHPWKWFSELFSNIRAAYRRAKYGWCYMDAWDCGCWLLEILPQMLRHIAEYGCGSPIGYEETEWHDWLNNMANKLELLQEDNWYSQNEYEKEFHRLSDLRRKEIRNSKGLLTINWENDEDFERIKNLYFNRNTELNNERDRLLKEVGTELFEKIPNLWDQEVTNVLFKGSTNCAN